MGSCISKCKPKKKPKQDFNWHVQDKLIISEDPIPSIPPESENRKHLSPAPSTSSTASFSSFSCSTNTATKCNTTSSASSSSSSHCSSSLLTAMDRSFSNEFLRSCAKDNPHIISRNPKAAIIEKNDRDVKKPFAGTNKIQYYPQNLDPCASPLVKTKQTVQEKATNYVPTPKKRARANSPTLVRQKSFRREQSFNPTPNRALRSPSPSRRFNNGDNGRYVPIPRNGTSEGSYNYRREILSRGNNATNSCPKRESVRASPKRDPVGRNFSTRKKDTSIPQQVSAKIGDHVCVGDIKEMQEMDIVMEDINNPHIALDCFIFL